MSCEHPPVVADAGAREQLWLAHTVDLDLDVDRVSWLCKQNGSLVIGEHPSARADYYPFLK
jgi:hypothetical protein